MGMDLPAVVPVLRIDVGGQPIQKDVEIPGTLEIFEDHAGTLQDLDGLAPTFTSPIGMQGRGNFTWTLPKKGYAFELQGVYQMPWRLTAGLNFSYFSGGPVSTVGAARFFGTMTKS